jgi:hypothetical protein
MYIDVRRKGKCIVYKHEQEWEFPSGKEEPLSLKHLEVRVRRQRSIHHGAQRVSAPNSLDY